MMNGKLQYLNNYIPNMQEQTIKLSDPVVEINEK